MRTISWQVSVAKLTTFGWFITLCVAGYALYLAGIGSQYYGDDFHWVFKDPEAEIFFYWLNPNPVAPSYRPLQASIVALLQLFFGWNTVPLHSIQILIHVILALLIYDFMSKQGFSRLQACLGSAYMLVSQANVQAVAGSDSLSQIGGTLFGYASLWCLSRVSVEQNENETYGMQVMRNKVYLFSLVLFALSLFMKETSLSFLLLIISFLFLKNLRNHTLRQSLVRTTSVSIPYLIVFALYFVLWFSVMGELKGGRYGLNLGLNVFVNLAFLAMAALTPVSSAALFTAFANRDILLLGITSLLTFLFAVFVLLGIWRSRQYRRTAVLTIFSIMSLFPVLFFTQVSELYVYNMMPLVSILVGIGLGEFLQLGRINKIAQSLAVAFIGVLLVSNVLAVESKTAQIRINGERAAVLLHDVLSYVDRVPPNGELLLIAPEDPPQEYSVFNITGFNSLRGGCT